MQRLITQTSQKGLKYFDIAANLADDMFKGHYYGKPAHECDIDHVLSRATQHGVDRLLIVGGHIQDTLDSFEICKKNPNMYKTTVGVHPCRANEVFKGGKSEIDYYERMDKLITELGSAVTAVGECGLDYDRLEYSDKDTQLKVFPMHFDLAQKHGLPMYLHSRNCPTDFLKLVKQNRSKFSTGCVHSYTGEEAELREILEMGLYVGINGCSLKTPENIEIAKKVPLDRLMIESRFIVIPADSPYCESNKNHASFQYVVTQFPSVDRKKWRPDALIKSRNEPCKIVQVAEILAAIRKEPIELIAAAAYQNSVKVFGGVTQTLEAKLA